MEIKGINLKNIIKECIKKFNKGSSKTAKVYNKNGILLFEEDVNLLCAGDVLYIALEGESFNYCAILDDYEMGRTLGVGGFGKVILAKHKETKKQVAIKFSDVGHELSTANTISAIYKEAEALKGLIHKHII
jgi:serine/threonine protein kinase